MGYYPEQLKEFEQTIARSECDAVIIGTPFNLRRLLKVDKPCAKVSYELEDMASPALRDLVSEWITTHVKKG
jgi:predicted GTPase